MWAAQGQNCQAPGSLPSPLPPLLPIIKLGLGSPPAQGGLARSSSMPTCPAGVPPLVLSAGEAPGALTLTLTRATRREAARGDVPSLLASALSLSPGGTRLRPRHVGAGEDSLVRNGPVVIYGQCKCSPAHPVAEPVRH